MNVPGSLSSALQTTRLRPAVPATARHFRPVGNAAPPRPHSPEASSSGSTHAGSALHGHGKGGVAAACAGSRRGARGPSVPTLASSRRVSGIGGSALRGGGDLLDRGLGVEAAVHDGHGRAVALPEAGDGLPLDRGGPGSAAGAACASPRNRRGAP